MKIRSLFGLTIALAACGEVGTNTAPTGPVGTGESTSSISAPSKSQANSSPATVTAPAAPIGQTSSGQAPVLTFQIANGNQISIYDFGKDALITESGLAHTDPVLAKERAKNPTQLTDLVLALRPDLPIPQALTDLQSRLAKVTASTPPISEADVSRAAPVLEGGPLVAPKTIASSGGIHPDTDVGCNNGCCDPDWTANSLCKPYVTGHNYYYLFNYNWSHEYLNNIRSWAGTVCSAVGTSTWTLNGSGVTTTTFTVPEAHYLGASWWYQGLWLAGSMNSNANSAANPHLNMQCGYANYYYQ